MADVKWNTFASAVAIAASDVLVGLQGLPQDNVQYTAAQVKTFVNTNVLLAAGAAGAGLAPIYYQSGPLLTTPVAGAVEFLTDKWYGTITTGAARKEFTLNDAALTSGRIPYTTTNGRLLDSANLLYSDANQRISIGTVNAVAGNLNALTVQNISNANNATVSILMANNSPGLLQITGYGASFTTSGLLSANLASFTNLIPDSHMLFITTGSGGSGSGRFMWSIGAGGYLSAIAETEAMRLSGNPNGNNGTILQVKNSWNNASNAAYAAVDIANVSGLKGRISVASPNFTTVGIYSANNFNVIAMTDDLVLATVSSAKAIKLAAGDAATSNIVVTFALNAITVADATNFVLNTTTGSKWGTATGQKQAWWGATPVAQQVLATGGGATVDNVITLLQTLGLCKQS